MWYKTGIAYNQRYRWDGGAAGLDAVLGRQSLGLGSAATRAAADTVGNDEALPDGAAVINYINGRGFISNPNDSVDASELEVLFGPLGAGLMVRSASGVFLITPDNHKGWDTAYNNIIQYASNWQTAFTERRQWDGGATGLNAATGRTSLQLDTYYSGINHNHGTGTTNYFPVFSNGVSGTIKNSSISIGTYMTGDTYMDYGQNSVQNLLLTAQGSTGTYLVGQHNLLYNADKRSGYSVSQAGDIVFSPTSALFDGSELVYLVSGNIEPTTPTVISVIFPEIHPQLNYWYFG